jgi:hypothetical protein
LRPLLGVSVLRCLRAPPPLTRGLPRPHQPGARPMGDYAMMEWLERHAPPPLSYSECMDKLFTFWCESNDGCTFEELIGAGESDGGANGTL